MFNYSEKTKTNKEFKLKEILKMINASKEIKQDASNIKRLCLSHVLSTATTNMDPSDDVKEIYIIDVELDSPLIPTKFLSEFDKQIYFQVLFKLKYGNYIAYGLSLKEIVDEKVKILSTKYTAWDNSVKEKIDATNKLKSVYKKMAEFIYKYKFKDDETISQYSKRMDTIHRIENQISQQTKIMNNEKQPNIKLKINADIKKLNEKLEMLTKGD